MRSDSRPSRLLATVHSVHVSRHEAVAGLSEEGPPSEETSSLILLSWPYLGIFCGANFVAVTWPQHPLIANKERKKVEASASWTWIKFGWRRIFSLICDVTSFIQQGDLPWQGAMVPSRSAVRLNDVSPRLRPSHGTCFICYTNISAALPYLIYGSETDGALTSEQIMEASPLKCLVLIF